MINCHEQNFICFLTYEHGLSFLFILIRPPSSHTALFGVGKELGEEYGEEVGEEFGEEVRCDIGNKDGYEDGEDDGYDEGLVVDWEHLSHDFGHFICTLSFLQCFRFCATNSQLWAFNALFIQTGFVVSSQGQVLHVKLHFSFTIAILHKLSAPSFNFSQVVNPSSGNMKVSIESKHNEGSPHSPQLLVQCDLINGHEQNFIFFLTYEHGLSFEFILIRPPSSHTAFFGVGEEDGCNIGDKDGYDDGERVGEDDGDIVGEEDGFDEGLDVTWAQVLHVKRHFSWKIGSIHIISASSNIFSQALFQKGSVESEHIVGKEVGTGDINVGLYEPWKLGFWLESTVGSIVLSIACKLGFWLMSTVGTIVLSIVGIIDGFEVGIDEYLYEGCDDEISVDLDGNWKEGVIDGSDEGLYVSCVDGNNVEDSSFWSLGCDVGSVDGNNGGKDSEFWSVGCDVDETVQSLHVCLQWLFTFVILQILSLFVLLLNHLQFLFLFENFNFGMLPDLSLHSDFNNRDNDNNGTVVLNNEGW